MLLLLRGTDYKDGEKYILQQERGSKYDGIFCIQEH